MLFFYQIRDAITHKNIISDIVIVKINWVALLLLSNAIKVKILERDEEKRSLPITSRLCTFYNFIHIVPEILIYFSE